MYFTSSNLPDVHEIELITATSTFGVGFFTSIALGFCNIFGLECNLYNKKIERAKESAENKLLEMASDKGANGVMNISYQVTGMTVFVSGTAFSSEHN